MKKKYVIESKGFTQGIGSTSYSKKRIEKLQDLKKQIAELEQKINS